LKGSFQDRKQKNAAIAIFLEAELKAAFFSPKPNVFQYDNDRDRMIIIL